MKMEGDLTTEGYRNDDDIYSRRFISHQDGFSYYRSKSTLVPGWGRVYPCSKATSGCAAYLLG
jgi:hypothetical protein